VALKPGPSGKTSVMKVKRKKPEYRKGNSGFFILWWTKLETLRTIAAQHPPDTNL
jgi:hypothetical protein